MKKSSNTNQEMAVFTRAQTRFLRLLKEAEAFESIDSERVSTIKNRKNFNELAKAAAALQKALKPFEITSMLNRAHLVKELQEVRAFRPQDNYALILEDMAYFLGHLRRAAKNGGGRGAQKDRRVYAWMDIAMDEWKSAGCLGEPNPSPTGKFMKALNLFEGNSALFNVETPKVSADQVRGFLSDQKNEIPT